MPRGFSLRLAFGAGKAIKSAITYVIYIPSGSDKYLVVTTNDTYKVKE